MRKYFTVWNLYILICAAIFGLTIYQMTLPYEQKDDSDGPHENSHMEVYTDHLTGCQYLSHWSLTPRMGADGKQICKKVN
jgi:Family of unknown function (DUF6440)